LTANGNPDASVNNPIVICGSRRRSLELCRVRHNSKEHRVDAQIVVGLLVDPTGFSLEVHLFEGNTAQTTTILPVLHRFQESHRITGMVVVADAGMLSATNLNEIEDAGFSFVVGSRITKAPLRPRRPLRTPLGSPLPDLTKHY